MKRLLAVAAVLLVALIAHATNPPDRQGLSEREGIIALNGRATWLGNVISMDGLTHNNCNTTLVDAGTTGAAFDAGLGDYLKVVSTIDQFCRPGDCATTVTSVNGDPVTAGQPYFTILGNDDMAIACMPQDGGTTGTSKYFHMQ